MVATRFVLSDILVFVLTQNGRNETACFKRLNFEHNFVVSVNVSNRLYLYNIRSPLLLLDLISRTKCHRSRNIKFKPSININTTYVVGFKSFRPDIQKPRQMENAVRDI